MINFLLPLFQVRDLIDKIREVFIETLDELQWMDEASKVKAREKVRDNKTSVFHHEYEVFGIL